MPVVLALHGAAMNGSMMVWFSGLNKKSDEAGFIVVYPSGTGIGPFCAWNAGNFGARTADDVAFVGKLLDDFASVVSVDEKRVYACGMSNGGMMCYRLAAELSERFIGKSAKNISANDLMWKFFQKHPMKELASAFVATSRRLVGQL
jgi:polyhydroxybutyrate depolymerase